MRQVDKLGKTKKGALRSLKRHLARRFYHLLMLPTDSHLADKIPQPRPPHNADRHEANITFTAPAVMPCLK